MVAGWERKGMVRKGEYRDGGWWLGDDGFVDGGLEMMALEMMALGWWVVNAVLGIVDGILKIVHFFCMFALLSTCDRPAVDPRKTPEGIEEREILIIGHFFWGAYLAK